MMAPAAAAIAVDQIKAATALATGITVAQIDGTRHTRPVAHARHAGIWLARQLTGPSLPAIARQFGGRDHTTILYALRRVETRMAEDASYRAWLDQLARDLADRIGPPAPVAAGR